MYATFGNYRHEGATGCNLVRMEYVPKFTARGKRWATLFRLHVQGCLIYDSQSELHTAITNLITAYAYDGESWILWHDDNTMTNHRLEQNNPLALSDVQVEYRSWPNGDPSEYATGRTFYIILRQLLDTHESQVLDRGESVRFIGTGGPEFKIVALPNGVPVVQQTSLYSPIQVIQRGHVTQFSTWPTFPWVSAPMFPAFENQRARIIDYIGPHFTGKTWTHYGVNWTYVFNFPSPQALSMAHS